MPTNQEWLFQLPITDCTGLMAALTMGLEIHLNGIHYAWPEQMTLRRKLLHPRRVQPRTYRVCDLRAW